ncbi:PREDICTED: mucin-17 isoform X2 [Dufourea novaeangliae]|uniref:mucin-17 isoform X2 n=1 Tax=Dufourea novaeangliae TaxID=178035 RepID=UPI0007678434|nr:PREDICTED: mucin-17 isoform X2 [Dufourea novaeangliae]
MSGYAWVTLATNDAYSLGALVLAHSLRRVGTKHELAVLVTPGVTEVMREKLSAVFSVVMEVNVLDSKDEANLALLARPELGITFTKLHCWRLSQYDKCVFLDADTLVVRNCDELFEREELSAAPDVGWPDCFNSGVFVYKPSQQTFASITAFAAAKGSFDGGDQGLLNMYFSDWAHKDISKHLPFIYNMCSTAVYSYLPAFKQFGDDVRIIHFIGITKPWLQYFDTLTGIVQPPMESAHLQPLLQLWWNIFCDKVHPHLSPVMAGLAGALAQITLGEPRSAEQIALEEHMRKQSWEQGHIDYMGRDSFDNIWKKICQTLSLAPTRLPSPPKEIQKPTKTAASDETAKSTECTESTEVIEPTKSIGVVEPTESTEVVESTQSTEARDEVDKRTAQAATSPTEEQSLLTNVPVTDNGSTESKLSEKSEHVIEITTTAAKNEKEQTALQETAKDISEKSSTGLKSECVDTVVVASFMQLETQAPEKVVEQLGTSSLLKEIPRETSESIAPQDSVPPSSIEEQKVEVLSNKDNVSLVTSTEEFPSNLTNLEVAVDTEQIKQFDITDEKHAKVFSTASEVLTVSPVPIQVAESVLQVEPKESVSDSETMSQEILSSTIIPVHESNIPCSEAFPESERKLQINGSASTLEPIQDKGLTPDTVRPEESIDTFEESSELFIKAIGALQISSPVEERQTVESLALSSSSITVDTRTPETCTLENLQQMPESVQETKETESPTTKEESSKTPLECDITKTPPSVENPVRPSRVKELNQPSKSLQESPSQEKEKVVKKTVKKSLEKSMSEGEPPETAEGDNNGKKVVKKVVKKVAKKPKAKTEEGLDDGTEESSSAGKQKKTVKVVKKGTKSAQTHDTDTTIVPENPSSSTSDVPVPPKRKAKAATTKPVVKKSDVE